MSLFINASIYLFAKACKKKLKSHSRQLYFTKKIQIEGLISQCFKQNQTEKANSEHF